MRDRKRRKKFEKKEERDGEQEKWSPQISTGLSSLLCLASLVAFWPTNKVDKDLGQCKLGFSLLVGDGF